MLTPPSLSSMLEMATVPDHPAGVVGGSVLYVPVLEATMLPAPYVMCHVPLESMYTEHGTPPIVVS